MNDKKSNRLPALLLALTLFLLPMPSLAALAESADTSGITTPSDLPTECPAVTEEPALPPDSSDPTAPPADKPDCPYNITFGMPKGWSNAETAELVIRIQDKGQAGWTKVEIKLGSEWTDITERFAEAESDKITLSVTDNGKAVVRVTDAHGNLYKESVAVRHFDREAPAVTAGIDDLLLHVEAVDKLSGVAGIQVNGLLFTTLENGALNVRMEDVLNQYDKLAIRAYDAVGNFSAPVTLDNPYYGQPLPEATPAPTDAPKPTKKPSGGSGGKPTKKPQTTAAPVPVVTSAPETSTEYIILGPGMPFASAGNMNTLDVLYSAHTNKQFISVQSRSGETYYLVIDYDKPIDADAELYETYFLNLVDDRDLLAVLDEEEKPTPTPEIIYVTPEPTAIPAAHEPPAETQPSGVSPSMLLLVIAVLAGGGVLWYFKQRRQGQRSLPPMPDYELEDEDEEDADEDESEGE